MVECRSLGLTGPYEPAFFELEVDDPADGEVLVETVYSGLSAGTELAYVKGTDPGFTSRRDLELGAFVPDGPPSRAFPIPVMGYMEVGRVVASRRDDLEPGRLVGAAYGHRSCAVLGTDSVVVPVPEGVDPVLGIYLAQMGPIAANGLLHAAQDQPEEDPDLGAGVRDRQVLVTGAGVVGLLTAMFAVLHGARSVVVADPDPSRLAVATSLGLDVIDERTVEPWRWCKETWHHGDRDRGADLVLQCRGRDTALHQALKSLRPQGVVVDLAFYQGGAPELRLGEEFHHNGLTIRCAQIARVPRRLRRTWDRERLAAETARLLLDKGTALREHLVTDVVPVDEAPELLLALARRERSASQVAFRFG